MHTELLDAGRPASIELAADLLRRGHLVAFPTDTLYGVGANAFAPTAVERLYMAKNRPHKKGIPILLANPDDLDRVAQDVPTMAWALIERFWPGPLTLILPKRRDLPDIITPNQGVAVRIPDNAVARRLIREAGGAIAATSANRSGEAPACNAQQTLAALDGLIAAVLDGGTVHHKAASTILDCTVTPPRLLRRGPVAARELPGTVLNRR